MNRISLRSISILSAIVLTLVMTVAVSGQTSSVPEKLTRDQLDSLIATAQTPAEHNRIADYYQAQARNYEAQAQEHQAMIAAYKANSTLSNDKNQASTIGHCEYFVQTFKTLAAKSQELAQLHGQMAKETGLPVEASKFGK